MSVKNRRITWSLSCAFATVAVLNACGGGGGGTAQAAAVSDEGPVTAPSTSPSPAPAPAPVSSGVISASLAATRVSGTAPLAVQFDATGTTSTTSGVDTFRQVTYSFNFGDDRGLTWAISGQPKNTQVGGPLAAHVFDNPGTYTVTLTATDSSGNASSKTVTITVADPASVYSGTKTVCVSPSSNFSGCPSGSATQTSLPSGTAWNGKRVLLHRGETFGDISIQDGNSGVQVAPYGTGNKPAVGTVNVGNWRPSTANFASDVTVMDMNVKNSMQQSLGQRVLFYRNDVQVTAGSGGIMMSMGEEDFWYRGDASRVVAQSAFYNAREIFIVENNALGANTVDALVGFWGSGARSAVMGNSFGKYQQHSARISGLYKGVVAHNEMRGISSDGIRVALKLHSMGLNAYADGSINDTSGTGGWATNQVVIANNVFGSTSDNNAWTVAVAPQNDVYAEGIENVILENNRFVRGSKTSTDLVIGGRKITYRKNTTASGAALIVGDDKGALPTSWVGPNFAQ